jgi:hypothetical protein
MSDFNFADPNATYGGYGGGMNLDANTLATFLQSAPAIQQAQRRAEQLKAYQQGYQAMAQNPKGTGNYTPAQQGGLYPTVQKWMPDYAKMGQQIQGAIGNAMGQPQANSAEDVYNQMKNAAVMRAVQQASSQGGVMGGGGFGSGNLYGTGWPGQGGGWAGQ